MQNLSKSGKKRKPVTSGWQKETGVAAVGCGGVTFLV
jgi:hypothetical protein